MKSFRWVVLIYTCAIFGILHPANQNTILAAEKTQKENKEISFYWAFGALVGKENDRKLVSITGDTTLHTGDQLKMMIELKKKCFVYLIYTDGKGELKLLFPYNIEKFTDYCKTSERYYIPQGKYWFVLDKSAGLETFHLLASVNRFTELEGLINQYESADESKKPEIANKTIEEIKKIRKRRKPLTTFAERPVLIAGGVRGISDQTVPLHDVASLSVQISAFDFYCRIFTIEHK